MYFITACTWEKYTALTPEHQLLTQNLTQPKP